MIDEKVCNDILCKCGNKVEMTNDDKKFNLLKCAEQKEFRKIGEIFNLGYRYHCPLCGIIFIVKKIKRNT